MLENDISAIIVDSAIYVHRALGPGLLESVYEVALAHVLTKQVLTYLRLSGLRPGLLLDFGAPMMKDGIDRLANNMP